MAPKHITPHIAHVHVCVQVQVLLYIFFEKGGVPMGGGGPEGWETRKASQFSNFPSSTPRSSGIDPEMISARQGHLISLNAHRGYIQSLIVLRYYESALILV